MKAAVFLEPGRLVVTDRDDPVPEPGGLVLRIEACALCGTDLRVFRHGHRRISPPAIIGHEIAGTVAELGEGVSGYQEGDLVVLAPPAWSCGSCRRCLRGRENLCEQRRALAYELPGGLAEKAAIPEPLVSGGCLHHVPLGTDPAEVAVAEPLACCINGQSRLAAPADARAVVIGAGPIGLMHALLLKARGLKNIAVADSVISRLERAGAIEGLRPVNIGTGVFSDQAGCGSDGADLVIVAASSGDAYRSAFEIVGRGGEVLLFAGLPASEQEMAIDMNRIHYKELAWYGSFASMPEQGREALRLLTTGPPEFSRLVTHRFPLDDVEEAFRAAGSLEGLKVVVQPGAV